MYEKLKEAKRKAVHAEYDGFHRSPKQSLISVTKALMATKVREAQIKEEKS